MRVMLERLPDGRFALPIPDSYVDRAGWREGDEIAIHQVHGGSMLTMRTWQRREEPVDIERTVPA